MIERSWSAGRYYRVGLPDSSIDWELVSQDALDRFIAAFGYPLRGSGRFVFYDASKDCVYKLAFTRAGARESADEATGMIDDVPIARAHMTQVLGVQVLQMEWVDIITDARTHIAAEDREQYDWVRRVDYWQVGYTASGELVAYDGGQVSRAHLAYQNWPA